LPASPYHFWFAITFASVIEAANDRGAAPSTAPS
jgi:hypothetical protein